MKTITLIFVSVNLLFTSLTPTSAKNGAEIGSLTEHSYLIEKTTAETNSANLPENNEENYITTIQLQTINTSLSTTSNTYSVDFSSSINLTGVQLKPTQQLLFKDASGASVSLSFSVNSFLAGQGSLSVNFELGEANLTGLQIETTQIVITEDFVVN